MRQTDHHGECFRQMHTSIETAIAGSNNLLQFTSVSQSHFQHFLSPHRIQCSQSTDSHHRLGHVRQHDVVIRSGSHRHSRRRRKRHPQTRNGPFPLQSVILEDIHSVQKREIQRYPAVEKTTISEYRKSATKDTPAPNTSQSRFYHISTLVTTSHTVSYPSTHPEKTFDRHSPKVILPLSKLDYKHPP